MHCALRLPDNTRACATVRTETPRSPNSELPTPNALSLFVVYRESRLKVAITAALPDLVTDTSAFHVPSMATFAVNR